VSNFLETPCPRKPVQGPSPNVRIVSFSKFRAIDVANDGRRPQPQVGETLERQYFRDTSVFPPQHLIVIRRDVWNADRTIARRITDAFIACENEFRASVRSLPYVSPWLDIELDETEAALGRNPYARGLAENRAMMELFADQVYRAGLTDHRVAVDDYFAEFLAS
jgi:4,5-dihydroxyphthalate decarboxylase